MMCYVFVPVRLDSFALSQQLTIRPINFDQGLDRGVYGSTTSLLSFLFMAVVDFTILDPVQHFVLT
jgi:hypothetical protein